MKTCPECGEKRSRFDSDVCLECEVADGLGLVVLQPGRSMTVAELTEEHYPYAIFNQAAIKERKKALRLYIREHPQEVRRIAEKAR